MIKNKKNAQTISNETPPQKTDNKTNNKKLTAEDLKYRDMIQKYVLQHIFCDKEVFNDKVPPLFWRRINGTLEGSRYSGIKNGKTPEKIYTYKEIYETFLISTSSIDFAMKNNSFSDTSHLINYIFVIINSEIVDVHLRNVRKEREAKRIKEMESVKTIDEIVDDNQNICYDDYGYVKRENNDLDEAILEDLF